MFTDTGIGVKYRLTLHDLLVYNFFPFTYPYYYKEIEQKSILELFSFLLISRPINIFSSTV